ncbi:unnamed protein product [Heterotrigona itama]|uniref:Glycoside hydrolase family 38 N-terminal domain-containing protein n=1 Tax=Heterotrigona itama TaxID=395501 RepID=A0A6V7H8E1_9HYME|nr:unnamed protein product [Heterotrigona itama]
MKCDAKFYARLDLSNTITLYTISLQYRNEELNILCIRLGTNRAFLSVLQVILVPHSHTDPGWLKTFEQYFHSSTRSILNNMVSKLQQWPNMTFIWSEVSFLSLWWER